MLCSFIYPEPEKKGESWPTKPFSEKSNLRKAFRIQVITAEYRERMYRLLELYGQAYDPKQPLVCMDEKSKQLIVDSRPALPAKPDRVEKYDYEYKRKGICNVFIAVAPRAGKRIVKVTDTRKKQDFAYFMEELVDKHFGKADFIQVVLDNLNTHFAGSLIETFGKRKAGCSKGLDSYTRLTMTVGSIWRRLK